MLLNRVALTLSLAKDKRGQELVAGVLPHLGKGCANKQSGFFSARRHIAAAFSKSGKNTASGETVPSGGMSLVSRRKLDETCGFSCGAPVK
ncbi:hypothetical protein [uncultured Bartonella sp.]|uniref:hypothetical protein n=1 Tax=uncultured Bartonella sp. TaxID=104108 RepID=UPI0026315ABE|nr:hypothetical protein [uncultured Bartonella sp.]